MKIRFPALLRPIGILLGAVAIAAVMISSRPEVTPRSVDRPLPIVETQTIRRGTLDVTIVAYGNVAAWRELSLAAQVTGRVLWKAEDFEPGVVVAAGAPLLRIDDTDYRLALAEARQALASAELSLADAESLKQAARVDEARAAVAAAEARIARAQRDLQNTELRAPFDAVIDSQLVEIGQYVTTGMQVGRILGSEKAEVRLPITAQDVALLDAGTDVAVTLFSTVAPYRQQWEGRLARIERRVDDQTRVFPVVVEVADPLDAQQHGEPLPFGAFVRAEIPGRAIDSAVRIPQSALHGENDVFVLVDGKLQRRPVEILRLNEGQALVTGGLADGDRVVTTRLDLMFEGMQAAILDG